MIKNGIIIYRTKNLRKLKTYRILLLYTNKIEISFLLISMGVFKMFKKGKSGNDIGRPIEPREVQLAKTLNREFVASKMTELLRKPLSELQEISQDFDEQAIDCWLAKIITMGISMGDAVRLNFMFDRIIGKVTEIKEVQILEPFRIESRKGETIELGMRNIKDVD